MADACACNEITTMVFSCSGGSDVGGLSDRVARKIARDGKAKMYCLSGLGADFHNLKDYGFEKGKSQVDDTVVNGIAAKIA